MDFQPSRRLLAVAGLIGAGLALVLGLVWWRAPRLAAMAPRPVLADDVERWFAPGEMGREGGGSVAGLAEPGGKGPGSATPATVGRSPFLTRALGGVETGDGGAWAQFNGVTSRLEFSHNLGGVFPPELYDTHPEFFPLEGGKRLRPPKGSGWWNPDISTPEAAAFAANKAREHFAKHPEAVSFALGVTDGLIYGESPGLLSLTTPLRWFRERPDYSNLVFTFLNRAAADLATTHPDKYLGTLAYYWTEDTPDFPVHPQVIPFLTADRSQGYDRAFREEERALQARWVARRAEGGRRRAEDGGRTTEGGGLESDVSHLSSAIGPQVRLGLYDYIYGNGFLIPRIHTRLIAENLREARRLGFTDYYAEIFPNWGLDGPQPWLVAQLLQDPEQSERALLAEYYRRYFREAAFPMQRFFERCEEQWMQQPGRSYWLKHYRNESQAAIFPSAVCRELKGILDEALGQAKSEIARIRVRQVRDAFGVTQRFVAMQEARDAANRLALAGKATDEDLLAALGRFQVMRESFVTYTERLQREQPLLVGPFRMVDYLLNDPTANVLARVKGGLAVAGLAEPGGRAASAIGPGSATPATARATAGDELIANPELRGPLQSARVIAGLAYKVALPAPWQSKVEPSEHQTAGIKAGQPGVLFIGGSKDAEVFQWAALGQRSFVRAQVQLRGRVSESTVVMLTHSWLDANHRHLKMAAIRLPEGEWPAWVDLVQAAEAPTGAAWVGLSLTIRHQAKDDWIEAKGFSLRGQPSR